MLPDQATCRLHPLILSVDVERFLPIAGARLNADGILAIQAECGDVVFAAYRQIQACHAVCVDGNAIQSHVVRDKIQQAAMRGEQQASTIFDGLIQKAASPGDS